MNRANRDHTPFMAYAHEPQSRHAAAELALRLKRDGISVWMDQFDLKPGDLWEPALRSALGSAKVVLAIVGKAKDSQGWLEKELEFAAEQEKVVIPILTEGVGFEDIPEVIRDRQAVVTPTQDEQAYRQLLWALGQSKPTADDPDTLPWWRRIRSYVINE